MSNFCWKKKLIQNFIAVIDDNFENLSFQKACADKLLGQNIKRVSLFKLISSSLWEIIESIKKAHIFFRNHTATSPLGCRQVIWSIRLARLSFMETNNLLVFLLLLPATYNLSNEQSRFSQPGCSSHRAN